MMQDQSWDRVLRSRKELAPGTSSPAMLYLDSSPTSPLGPHRISTVCFKKKTNSAERMVGGNRNETRFETFSNKKKNTIFKNPQNRSHCLKAIQLTLRFETTVSNYCFRIYCCSALASGRFPIGLTQL